MNLEKDFFNMLEILSILKYVKDSEDKVYKHQIRLIHYLLKCLMQDKKSYELLSLYSKINIITICDYDEIIEWLLFKGLVSIHLPSTGAYLKITSKGDEFLANLQIEHLQVVSTLIQEIIKDSIKLNDLRKKTIPYVEILKNEIKNK